MMPGSKGKQAKRLCSRLVAYYLSWRGEAKVGDEG